MYPCVYGIYTIYKTILTCTPVYMAYTLYKSIYTHHIQDDTDTYPSVYGIYTTYKLVYTPHTGA